MIGNLSREFKKYLKKISNLSTSGTVILFLVLFLTVCYWINNYSNLGFTFNRVNSVMKENFGSSKFLTYYSMDGCPHCKNFDETWNSLKTENKTSVGLRKVDSKNSEASSNGVQGFPTILLVDAKFKKIEECPTRDLKEILKFCKDKQ